ncbi:MAG: hypothetical protein HFACDABA_00283 [Anaerolineales bacterium]|nr:hypothetical protein [Anaerolineales bacterium]
MLTWLKNRLPEKRDILLALSMATFLVFSWSLRELFFNAPAFLLSFTVGNIVLIAAYMLAFALLESVALVLLMLILAALLPGALLKNGFAYKTSYLFIALGWLSVYLQFGMTNQPRVEFLAMQLAKFLAVWLTAVLLTHYLAPVRKIALDILDRMTIFFYIYAPLGVVSLVVVILRNLW